MLVLEEKVVQKAVKGARLRLSEEMIFPTSKSDTLSNFRFQIGHIVQILFQKLTRCEVFNSNSDTL